MIYINPNNPENIAARDIHYKNIKCLIRKKLNQPACIDNCIICTSAIHSIDLPPLLFDFIKDEDNLEKIITGNPQELSTIHNQFQNIVDLNYNGVVVKNRVELIFSYKNWFCNKDSIYYSAYDLSRKLERNTCTYCNRVYTSTIINKNGKKIIRPTFDHWYPKSDFPLLALSFYNLIPSCSNCNSSVKGAINFNLTDQVHPYVDSTQTEEFVFKYKYNSSLSKYRIFLQDVDSLNSKARKTLQGMYIDEMYNSHQSELRDLIKIKKNYSKSYIASIEKLFGNNLSKEEVYRILFGVEFDSTIFHKLPLSKFKSDILKDLNII